MSRRTLEILRRERMEMPVSTLIDLFVSTKRMEGKAPKTLTWYHGMLSKYAQHLGPDPKLPDISLDSARGFITGLQNRTTRFTDHPNRPDEEGGLSAQTVHGYVRALKVFGSWLVEEDFTAISPFTRLKRPKLPQPMIEILSDTEIKTLLDQINPRCFLGSRLMVIVLLLLDTGMRANELCTLKLEHVYMDDSKIKVWGKGSKERIIPFGARTRKAIMRYAQTFRPEPQRDDCLILSVEGLPLTTNGLFQVIHRLGKRAGVPRLHPHLFRHTFAVKYLMNGGDVMSLRLMLGHTDLSTVQIYMHLAESHIQIQHARFSPVDRLGILPKRKCSA